MTNEEFLEAWQKDGLTSVHKDIDDGWRHGNNVSEVFLDRSTAKFWRADYRVSGDGENHGIRDGDFEIAEVVPEKKLVEVTTYVKPKPWANVEPVYITLSDGTPVTPDHRDINPATGLQKGYVVLSGAERAKGYVEPFRDCYTHDKCGTDTTMNFSIAGTYAAQPEFYSGTYCSKCLGHFPTGPDGEFVWKGTTQKVGTRSIASKD